MAIPMAEGSFTSTKLRWCDQRPRSPIPCGFDYNTKRRIEGDIEDEVGVGGDGDKGGVAVPGSIVGVEYQLG